MILLPRITESGWVMYKGRPLKPVSRVLAGEWRFFTHIAKVRAIEWLGMSVALTVLNKPVRINRNPNA